jgi:DNA mismatch repair ATPase MutS
VAAIDLNLVCPDLTTDAGVLHIREGRHLLKEKRIEQFVANDTKMGSSNGTHGEEGHGRRGQARGYGKIHMITGPNNSG